MEYCTKCKIREATCKHKCKFCNYIDRRKTDIGNIIKEGFWSEKEIHFIIENLIYGKIDILNDFLPYLDDNKTLDDLVILVNTTMKIRGQLTYKVRVKCSVCGKDYLISPSRYLRTKKNKLNFYCDFECRNKGFKIFGSHANERNSQYNSEWTKCSMCGKKILLPKYKREQKNRFGDNHTFCSQKCYWNFRSKYYVKDKNMNYGIKFDEERLEEMRKQTSKLHSEHLYSQTQTKIQKIIVDLLINNGINYQEEYFLGEQSLDIYLSDYNLGIEINGDYWHTNPIKYKSDDKLSKQQLKQFTYDLKKYNYSLEHFPILYLWENDIKNNLKLCELLIMLFIKEGQLKDYNSFNYTLDEDKIKLNTNIIIPYYLLKNP